MKKIYFVVFLFLANFCFAQTNFPGNGKTGFGGPVGTGSLTVSDNGTVITFVLNKGTNNFNDALVLYIDSKEGGFTTTSGFLDAKDGLRRAISGYDGTNRSTLTFPVGFTPDFAVAFEVGPVPQPDPEQPGFAGVWALQAGSSEHTYITSANLTPIIDRSSSTYTVTVNKSDLGITDLVSFNFLGTYISNTAYRSNEAIGDLMTGFEQGYNNQTILTYNTYLSSALPVKLTDFRAGKSGNTVAINWTVAQESNIESYQVQRSADGVNFTTLQTVTARNQSGYQPRYASADNKPLNGINYYRLAIKENGKTEYSQVVRVTMTDASGNILVSYQPGTTKLNIKLVGADAGTYSIAVVNTTGQLLQNTTFEHDGAEVNKTISLNSGLSKGIYRVVLINNNTRTSQAFLVP